MASYPNEFRLIRLRLAREPGHPAGDPAHGYDILAPLDEEGRIEVAVWQANRAACRVRKFRSGGENDVGRLVRRDNGEWYFDYDPEDDSDDETGFRFDAERFVPGEYVSILEDDGETHTFRVTAVERL